MNEQAKIAYTRKAFLETLQEAQADLEEFGDMGVGVYIVDGLAVDYMLSKNEEDELEPPKLEDEQVEPMYLSEFIERLKFTISILDKPYNYKG